MIVRHAQEQNLPRIKDMYESVVTTMQNTPLDVWWQMGSHPSREQMMAALDTAGLLMAVDDGNPEAPVLGACIVNDEQGIDYNVVDWDVRCTDDEVAVIHLLGVSPAARGRGVGRALIAASAELAVQRGAKTLRLDTFNNNVPAINLYHACGFKDYGVYTIHVGRGLVHDSHLMEMDLRERAINLPNKICIVK